jgi:hypothetical protein
LDKAIGTPDELADCAIDTKPSPQLSTQHLNMNHSCGLGGDIAKRLLKHSTQTWNWYTRWARGMCYRQVQIMAPAFALCSQMELTAWPIRRCWVTRLLWPCAAGLRSLAAKQCQYPEAEHIRVEYVSIG